MVTLTEEQIDELPRLTSDGDFGDIDGPCLIGGKIDRIGLENVTFTFSDWSQVIAQYDPEDRPKIHDALPAPGTNGLWVAERVDYGCGLVIDFSSLSNPVRSW